MIACLRSRSAGGRARLGRSPAQAGPAGADRPAGRLPSPRPLPRPLGEAGLQVGELIELLGRQLAVGAGDDRPETRGDPGVAMVARLAGRAGLDREIAVPLAVKAVEQLGSRFHRRTCSLLAGYRLDAPGGTDAVGK